MTSSYSEKIAKLKNALENVFVKKTDIQNNLTSTDTNKPLSANQGKILDTNKVDKISGKSLSTNDFTNTYKTKLDNLDTLLESKASNTHTHGNLQNDGSVGTSNNINKNVITDGNGKITTEDKPAIPSASTTVPSADTTNGAYGSGTDYARANHQHPKSSLYAEANHNHDSVYLQINNLPAIPSDLEDLTDNTGILHFDDYIAYDDMGGVPLSDFSNDLDVSDFTDSYDTEFTPKSHTHSTSDITDLPTIPNNIEDLTLSTGVVQTDTGFDVISYDDTTDTLYWGLGALSLDLSRDEVYYNSYEVATLNDIPVITGKEDSSNKVSSWSATTNNTRYPSEKLVKDSLDAKANTNSLSTVATTGDYDDLNDKPNIPKVFYGTSSTSASSQTKSVNTSSDFSLETGVILIVKFTYAQDYSSTMSSPLQLSVNSGTATEVYQTDSDWFAPSGIWKAGEVVTFIYDGNDNRFVMSEGGVASTTYYGITILKDSVSSTSTTTSATPNAVKTAYDLANSRENPSNKITSWSATTTDTNYPSEKLVKDSLDGKANSSHSHSISDTTNLQTTLNSKLEESDLLDLIYPIGSIYMEKDTTSHSVCPIQLTLGGTWTRIENRFLYASENGQGIGTTGGAASVTLTANQSGIRAHGHGMAHTHNHRHQTGRRDVYAGNASAAGAIGYSSSSSLSYNTSYDDTASSKSTTDNNTAQNASEAHNNMPPYIIVNVWERTA